MHETEEINKDTNKRTRRNIVGGVASRRLEYAFVSEPMGRHWDTRRSTTATAAGDADG